MSEGLKSSFNSKVGLINFNMMCENRGSHIRVFLGCSRAYFLAQKSHFLFTKLFLVRGAIFWLDPKMRSAHPWKLTWHRTKAIFDLMGYFWRQWLPQVKSKSFLTMSKVYGRGRQKRKNFLVKKIFFHFSKKFL